MNLETNIGIWLSFALPIFNIKQMLMVQLLDSPNIIFF